MKIKTMKIKLTAFAILLFTLSCNTKTKTNTDSTINDKNQTLNVDEQKKKLNDQSLACISLMNSLAQDLNAANGSHDVKRSSAIQLSIDSAALENVKIGQKLIALENK